MTKENVIKLGTKHIIGIFAIIGLIVLGVYTYNTFKPGEYDSFANCLTEKGVKFYGAWWCPHCLEQKELFGNSINKVNYIECSDSKRGQFQICNDAGIQGYPTWEFADGTRESRVLTLAELSDKTSCPVN